MAGKKKGKAKGARAHDAAIAEAEDTKAIAVADKALTAPKDVEAAAKRSVREPGATGIGSGRALLFRLAHAADGTPAWWSPTRDSWLRDFWHTAPFLPGVVYSICGRNAAFRFEFTGPEKQVQYAKDLCAQADLGAGWQPFVVKISQDLLTQDNGAFIEVIRPARVRTSKGLLPAVKALDADGGMAWFAAWRGQLISIDQEEYKIEDDPADLPLGIAHLDAGRCTRTGDLDHPVKYQDRKGRWHKLAWWQVITLEDMPSPIEDMNGVGLCLHRDSTVLMANGKTKRVIDLVRSKSRENVTTIGPDGQLTTGAICGWHENHINGRGLVNIRGERARLVQGVQERNSWVTADHPVLTPSGWRKAGDLRDGDEIVTALPTPSAKQRQLLIGSLLGDMSLTKRHDRPRLSFAHVSSNEDWVHLKANALKEFGWSIRIRDSQNENHRSMIYAQGRAHAGLEELRRAFYKNGCKQIPIELLRDNLSPILLAAWYLDDGHIRDRESNIRNRKPRAGISCSGFDPSDVALAAFVIGQAGYDCNPVHNGHRHDRFDLLFSVEGSQKLFDDIAPYVPESMRYKLPHDTELFDAQLWDLGNADKMIDKVIIGHSKPPSAQTVYCIDVEETHNFVSSGIVVHNCAVSRVLRAAQILRDVAIYKQEKIGGRFAGSVWLTNVDADRITDAVTQAKSNADSEGLSRYMPPVIAQVMDPKADPKAVELALASLPDGFDEEAALRWYITELALGTGTDYSYLAPLPGGGLGTATQVETMARQTKGKSSRLWMNTIEFKFRYHGILPRDVDMNFVEVDEEEQLAQDEATGRRAETRSIRIMSGEITPQVARQIAVDEGDLQPDYLDMMAEEEATPERTEEPSEPEGGAAPGDVTEEPEEKDRLAAKWFWQQIKAIGDKLQLRRPGSGSEGDVNAYAAQLVNAFDEWAEKWAGRIASADERDRGPLIVEAAEEIDATMQAIAMKGLPEAYLLGLYEGDWEAEDELTDAGHLQIQNYTDRNLQFLEYSLGPDLQTKLKALGDEGLKDRDVVAGALGTFRGRVATYAGPYWVLIWKGTEERAKAQEQAQARQIPVTRHLDARAEHCDTCPPKAGEYKSWDDMEAECGGVPADGSDDCGCNCRCWLTLGG